MAFEAPLHVERLVLPGQRHAIDTPMASGTANSFLNVNAVIEINEIREVMHTIPLQRCLDREAFADGREHRRICPKL